VLSVLRHPTGTRFSGRDDNKVAQRPNTANPNQGVSADTLARSDPAINSRENKPAEEQTHVVTDSLSDDEPLFRVPPVTAIAGILIKDWAEGKFRAVPQVQKGNL
jgi:NAD+ diphosphatase